MLKTRDKVLLGIDIDGVFNIINIENKKNEICRTPIYYLNKILEYIPNCDVLITSSWGNTDNKTVEEMIKSGFKYPKRVIGNTGFCSEEYSRTKEIEEWFKKYNKQDCYKNRIYLDDEISLFDYYSRYASRTDVVVCRPDVGLNLDKSYEVICRLQGINLKYW